MVLNEFDPRRRWYKLFIAEAFIRRIAAKFPNSWQLCLFCCCRENLEGPRYSGCFQGPEAAALQAYQAKQKEEQEKLLKAA
jgi:hypothetical protein